MSFSIKNNRYLIARRILQLTILFLFAAGNYFGWKVLIGNYSSATLLDSIQLSDPYAALQILLSGFLIGTDILVGSVTVLLIYATIGGRIFCSWVCPVNLLSDLVLWLRNKIKIQLPNRILLTRETRYYILGLSLLLSIILGIAAFEIVSPISIFHRSIIFGIGGGWSIIVALFLFDFVIYKNGWCGHLCPLGAFYSVVGRYGFLKVQHYHKKCTMCIKCFDVCPEEQVLKIIGNKTGFIRSGDCTNCGRCIEVCDDDALKFANNYSNN